MEAENLEKAGEILGSLPDNGKPKGLNLDVTTTMTCACGHTIHALTPDFFKFMSDGVLLFQNNVCPGCKEGERADREMARFVCINCKRAWFRIPPTKDTTGFKFEAGKSYHTAGCPHCTDDTIKAVKIIEKMLHDKKLGRT